MNPSVLRTLLAGLVLGLSLGSFACADDGKGNDEDFCDEVLQIKGDLCNGGFDDSGLEDCLADHADGECSPLSCYQQEFSTCDELQAACDKCW